MYVCVHFLVKKYINSPQNGYSENVVHLIKIVKVLLKSKKIFIFYFEVSYFQNKASMYFIVTILLFISLY